MLSSPLLALLITFALSLIWLRINDFAAARGWISSDLSRKIIHIGTGPLFVLCWLLFPEQPASRYLAALVPLAITFQFFLVGSGLWKDEAAVRAMSRSGDRREILRGPLFYGIVFVLLTVLFWRTTPTGIVALMLLCGGDGLADVIGRRVSSPPLPWNLRKSVAGSLAMLAGGWLFATVMVSVYSAAGLLSLSLAQTLPAISLIAIAGTAVEMLPTPDLDNLTVSLAAVLLGIWLF